MPQLAPLLDKLDAKPFPEMTFSAVRSIASYINAHNTSSADIEEDINSLNTQQQDTFMKVLYCCLANDSRSSATYFRWHEKLHAIAGSGAIIRVMTDKNNMSPEKQQT
ncbi:ARP2/3 complex subunit [Trypanosoma conorhini]|uniref:Actin-related protein 2/3 complex subunit 5 n=1 Tax=Trypanosoma conorhini TaxID=83891 RepID=A0A3R7K746_9TRYP|nr:ARP2/3 complex subunit [Trypanosoma conorhini]RNF02842.1 ARP2/3 complex subunit [Trypanosoma conorhini]